LALRVLWAHTGVGPLNIKINLGRVGPEPSGWVMIPVLGLGFIWPVGA
jgi:hypothetical protein